MDGHRQAELVLPPGLDWLRQSAIGQSWLNCVPEVLHECVERWSLTIGEPFPDAYVSLAVPAKTATGLDVVLKLRYPDRESEHEAEALSAWGGSGVVRILDQDPQRCALLLERCVPGEYLSAMGQEIGLRALIALLPRLWITAAEPFTTLTEEVALWIANLPDEYAEAGEPFDRSLLDQAIATLADLAVSQAEQVLIHQDLHGHNVLSAEREPWLVIDPKPLVGEREFGLSPIIRSAEFGHSRNDVIYRLDRLTSELDLDRERARLWAFGHAVAWGFENGNVLPGHIETARWLLDA